MSKNDRHVVKDGDHWAVRARGAQRASVRADTQAQAQQAANRIVENAGGGEVIVHGVDGKIREKNTIGKSDPYPPAG